VVGRLSKAVSPFSRHSLWYEAKSYLVKVLSRERKGGEVRFVGLVGVNSINLLLRLADDRPNAPQNQ
jgi:hypothetical protein